MTQTPSAVRGADAGLAGLLAGASIEVAARELPEAAAALRDAGRARQVFIPWTPNLDAAAMMAATSRARDLGLSAVPHVVARRLGCEVQARDLLGELRQRGADAVLLVGGDLREPAGSFGSSFELLRSGLLQACGFARVGVCGYPEGHPLIADAVLRADLDAKLGYAREHGLGLFVVSQFCLDGAAVARWVAGLRARGVREPIRAGVAGPTSVARLIKLGVQCGIGNSLRALKGRLGSVTRLASAYDPAGIVREIAAARLDSPSLDPLSIHLFAFGGAAQTLRWLSRTSEDDAKLASG